MIGESLVQAGARSGRSVSQEHMRRYQGAVQQELPCEGRYPDVLNLQTVGALGKRDQWVYTGRHQSMEVMGENSGVALDHTQNSARGLAPKVSSFKGLQTQGLQGFLLTENAEAHADSRILCTLHGARVSLTGLDSPHISPKSAKGRLGAALTAPSQSLHQYSA